MQTPSRRLPGTARLSAADSPALRNSDDGTPRGSRTPAPEPAPGVMKALSPGVVDYLFRQLVSGESGEDIQWQREGTTLAAQPAGAELARRLSESDLDSLTPVELFHYVRAAQRLASWAEELREAAVERYCAPGPASPATDCWPDRREKQGPGA